MKLQLRTKDVELGPKDEAELLRRVDRLDKRLRRIDPDLINLEVVLERQPRRNEYTGHVRLDVMNRALPARKNRAPHIHTLIDQAFDDLEEQLEKSQAMLRREPERGRKRGMRSARKLAGDARDLQHEIALLDRARQGDRSAFDQAAEERLAGVRKVIFDES